MLLELAKRLGIESDRVTKKAQEYERLLQLKASAASGFHLKGASQLVICLDLAASAENSCIDKELAIKLSGLKKPSYNATKQTIKQVLGLNRDITFKDVCVQLGCPEIVSDAEELLQKFKSQPANSQQDLDHPCFKAAAIMALSKLRKLGADRARLQEMGGLKKTVFDKLVQSMITLQQSVEEQKPKQKATKRGNTFIDAIEAKAKEFQEQEDAKNAQSEVTQIDFAAWKKRMLEGAS